MILYAGHDKQFIRRSLRDVLCNMFELNGEAKRYLANAIVDLIQQLCREAFEAGVKEERRRQGGSWQ